jgi:glucose/arabinose dehydrogenase
MKRFLLTALAGFLLSAPSWAQTNLPLNLIKLPPDFKISVFAQVPNARSMAVVPELDAVFVGNRRGHRLFVATGVQGAGAAANVAQIASGLKSPNGIAWKGGHLYVAEQHRVFRLKVPALDSIGQHEPEILFDKLPDKGWHGWRYIAFDTLGRLHVAVGAPCNICRVNGLEGTIIRLTGNNQAKIIARGVRNSIGIDFHPHTGHMYFTDNGADNMGDLVPPDELNHATRDGLHFGYPVFGGGTARTGQFRSHALPANNTPPVVEFGAHAAALGVHFYRGAQFPEDYRNDAFVAQHGSWSRSDPFGYRVMRIRMDAAGKVLGKEVFAEGWLQDGQAWGRPVDIKELPDGSLLVSDDEAEVIYRIWYGG